MENHFIKVASCTLLLGIALFSTSCQEPQVLFNSDKAGSERSDESAKLGDVTAFNQSDLATRIESYMNSKVAGYGYSIISDGKEFYLNNGGGGFARKLFETNPTAHGATAKQEIVSATQYVTAVAVMKAMSHHDLPLNYPVYTFLPSQWKPTNKFMSLTFEDLLKGRSGMTYFGDEDLRVSVEKHGGPKVNSGTTTKVDYQLLAMIVAQMHRQNLHWSGDQSLTKKFAAAKDDAELLTVGSQVFRDYVRAKVFTPAGLENAQVMDWRAWDSNGALPKAQATKGYPTKAGTEPGQLKADNDKNMSCGWTGLYISASQFTKLQYAVNKFKVIGEQRVALMKQLLIGYDGKLTGTKGAYYYKVGKGYQYNYETISFDFGTVQVSVFANSPESDIINPEVLANMFEQSIKPLQVSL
jgi:CubicO group peptidase (beta-lactamase class C family)